MNARERIEEIYNALQLARTMATEIDSVSKALDDAVSHPDHYSELYLTSTRSRESSPCGGK